MTTEELKKYALRTLIEEHLWKVGESDSFTYNNTKYKLEKTSDGFALIRNDKVMSFNTRMSRIFSELFRRNNISY